jgi:hypothetical protein
VLAVEEISWHSVKYRPGNNLNNLLGNLQVTVFTIEYGKVFMKLFGNVRFNFATPYLFLQSMCTVFKDEFNVAENKSEQLEWRKLLPTSSHQ